MDEMRLISITALDGQRSKAAVIRDPHPIDGGAGTQNTGKSFRGDTVHLFEFRSALSIGIVHHIAEDLHFDITFEAGDE
jgi:hypothetical protein